jgi:uncharacterized membrane protein YgcG
MTRSPRSPRSAEQLDARTLARRHRDALRRRTRRIRRSVAGLALALFAAAFLIVYVQLASGHDPALVANAARRADAAASAAGESSSTSSKTLTNEESSASGESTTRSGSSGSEGSGESSSSESGESSAGASAVTTSQS